MMRTCRDKFLKSSYEWFELYYYHINVRWCQYKKENNKIFHINIDAKVLN